MLEYIMNRIRCVRKDYMLFIVLGIIIKGFKVCGCLFFCFQYYFIIEYVYQSFSGVCFFGIFLVFLFKIYYLRFEWELLCDFLGNIGMSIGSFSYSQIFYFFSLYEVIKKFSIVDLFKDVFLYFFIFVSYGFCLVWVILVSSSFSSYLESL